MALKVEFIATLFLFFSIALPASVASTPTFSVVGRVYCDTCRAGFETNVTEYISGANVKIECTHFATGKVEHTNFGVTDSAGNYKIDVTDDHGEEICEVVLVDSPVADCKEIKHGRDRAQIVLTSEAGMSTNARLANSLGFLKSEPLPVCEKLIKEFYGLGEETY
ncbi:Pollen-specific protein C13 [Platanthera guangdongensis]|uniref:Pollen-specific protein C13 n=1 Tax=Platanthera guangdongensis TaxID=2320717 RepID=A0ABR2LWJ5_9ASPA